MSGNGGFLARRGRQRATMVVAARRKLVSGAAVNGGVDDGATVGEAAPGGVGASSAEGAGAIGLQEEAGEIRRREIHIPIAGPAGSKGCSGAGGEEINQVQ